MLYLGHKTDHWERERRWLSHIFNLLRIFSYDLFAKLLLFVHVNFYFQALKTNQKCIEYDFSSYQIVTGLEGADVYLQCSECRTQIICFECVSRRAKQRYKKTTIIINWPLNIREKKTISSRKFFIVSLNFKINKSWLAVVVGQTLRRP